VSTIIQEELKVMIQGWNALVEVPGLISGRDRVKKNSVFQKTDDKAGILGEMI
jgi:hypothetical protein